MHTGCLCYCVILITGNMPEEHDGKKTCNKPMTAESCTEKGAAELIGVMMLIAVFVAAGAVIAVTLFSQPAPEKVPAVFMIISNQSGFVEISHDGGDTIPLADMAISIDDRQVPAAAWSCMGCGSDWSIGDTIQIDCSNPANCPTNTPNKIDLIYKTAGQNHQLLTTRYLWTMTPTPTSGTLPPTTSPTPTPTATITSVTPPTAIFIGYPLTGTAPLTVAFTDASTGTPTSWNWIFGDMGAGNTSTEKNPVHAYTTPGAYSVNLTVSNAGGSNSLVQPDYVLVSYPAPTVISITPNSGYNDTSVSITDLSGTGFITGATVKLNSTGKPDIPATVITVVSSTKITCTFALNGAPAGARNVVVTNPDGKSGMVVNGFTIYQAFPAPTVTSRSNATVSRGWPGYELIGGTNLVSGAQSVINTTTGTSIQSTSCNVRSSTQMFCSYDLFEAPVSTAYRVAVINPDGKSGLMTTNLVSVASPAPTLSVRSPTSAPRGWPVSVTLTGANFQPGATVIMSRSGSTTINADNIVVASSSRITCTFDLTGATKATNWAIRVTNTDGQSSGTVAFSVTSVNPTVTKITPASGKQDTTVTITSLAGTNFQPGATVLFATNSGMSQNMMSLTYVKVISPTEISGTLVIPPKQTVGAYYVRVTNTDGTNGRSGSAIFSVSTP
jgi:PKD repeat protein